MSDSNPNDAQRELSEQSVAQSPKSFDKWWSSQRAQRSFAAALIIGLLSTLVWWHYFAPFIRTNDARVAATVVAFAPKGAGGQIVDLLVDEGDCVKKGDSLFKLDQRSARAQVKRAKAQNRWMSCELKRIQEQVKRGFASQRDLDRALCNAKSARADRQMARIALDNTIIKSTLDGTVVLKSAEVGDFLQPGQTALTIADLDHAFIAANIEETYVQRLCPGQSAVVSIDEGGSLKGTVKEIFNTTAAQFALIPADSGSGNYTKVVQRIPIKVSLDLQSKRTLRIGQSAVIQIRTKR